MRPAVEHKELERGQSSQKDQHEDRHRSSRRSIKKGKGAFPDVKEDQLGGIRRAAFGQDKQMVDQLDRIDQRIDQDKQRQHDAPGIGPAAGPFDLGGLAQVRGMVCKAARQKIMKNPASFQTITPQLAQSADPDGPRIDQRLFRRIFSRVRSSGSWKSNRPPSISMPPTP